MWFKYCLNSTVNNWGKGDPRLKQVDPVEFSDSQTYNSLLIRGFLTSQLPDGRIVLTHPKLREVFVYVPVRVGEDPRNFMPVESK
jgi:hypothetical protein